MRDNINPSFLDDDDQVVSGDLGTMIDEERRLFHLDDASEDDDDHRQRLERMRKLRADIAGFRINSIIDVVAKALYLNRLYDEYGETLDDAIAAEDQSDLSFGLVIARDLLSCPEVREFLKTPGVSDPCGHRHPPRSLQH